MDALQTVFDTILGVLAKIREFFEALFSAFAPKEDETTAPSEEA